MGALAVRGPLSLSCVEARGAVPARVTSTVRGKLSSNRPKRHLVLDVSDKEEVEPVGLLLPLPRVTLEPTLLLI